MCFSYRKTPFFLYLLPRSRLAESCFGSVGLFPPGWNGISHSWKFPGESLGRLFQPVGSPRFKSLGCWATWSPWLLPYRAIASVTFRACSYRCRSCSSHPSPALFSSETAASWVLTVSSAPDSERRSPLGRYPCSVSIFGLVASWSGGSGACLPFFPFPCPLEFFVTPRSMDRVLERDFPLGCSSFSVGVALPPQ